MKKVFLVCSGVGHINRGYESFTIECFQALSGSTQFELFLLKGAGNNTAHEKAIWCLKRNSTLALKAGKLLGRDTYWIEQFTFFLALIPRLIIYRPSLIYYSDFLLGTWLWNLRRVLKFRYKLLFSNGAPNGPPFTRTDHVQQLLPLYIEQAKKGATPEDIQTLLPYAINFSAEEHIRKVSGQQLYRTELRLPADKKIIISVGAVNSGHKRMDYVIDEFAELDTSKYFLVILGQIDDASNPILELARRKLPMESYCIRQEQSAVVKHYLFAADYFILASLNEGLPRVLPEALSAGLLPIVHDYGVTRQTLGEYGVFKDLRQSGTLSTALQEVNVRAINKEGLINYAWEKYSWEKLTSDYTRLIEKNL